MTSGSINIQQNKSTLTNNLKNGLLGGAIAAVISLVVWSLGNALAGPIEVAQRPGAPIAPLTWVMILVATFVPAIFGGLVLTGLQRFTANGTRIFQVLAVAIALLSLFPAITQSGSTASAIVLSLLHLAAAGSIVWALTLRQA